MQKRLNLPELIETLLMASGSPLPMERLLEILAMEDDAAGRADVNAALQEITRRCETRGYELCEVASGYRFQVRQEHTPWLIRLWDLSPQRYSRALLETLAIIAYRQPVTRGDVEKIRGVPVSTRIIYTLLEHDWVKEAGRRNAPGRPVLYETTKTFLDHFNLRSLKELPPMPVEPEDGGKV